jgi:hypothetical protein
MLTTSVLVYLVVICLSGGLYALARRFPENEEPRGGLTLFAVMLLIVGIPIAIGVGWIATCGVDCLP